MRAIDGDALRDRLQNLGYDDWNQGVTTTWAEAYKECADIVEDAPTIEPEPHWIPCEERLPEDGTECLISVICFKKVTIVDVATYSTDLYKVDKYDFHDKRGVSGWYQLDEEYGYMETLNAIAWMPLPEPYKEGES